MRQALQSLYYIHTRVTRNPTRAAEAAEKLAALRPDDLGALRRLAASSAQAHRVEAALKAYSELCERDPKHHAHYCEQVSTFCYNQGHRDLAVEWAAKIALIDKESHTHRVRAARQFQRLMFHDHAKKEYRKAVELAAGGPIRESYSLELASLLVKLRDKDRAIQICESVAANSKSRANRDRASLLLEQMDGGPNQDRSLRKQDR